jgi:hypothetical protein
MGTSVSHPSLRNTNWSAVHAGYQNAFIPENRIINEIWRACEKDATPISDMLKSKAIYECYSAVNSSNSFQEALKKFDTSIRENKNNSIVAEFAKRVIPSAFQSNNPAENWTARFFSELTNYVMSRDMSGFVGEKYRNKSVGELINFKRNITRKVFEIVSSEKVSIKTQKDWNSFVNKSVDKLKTTK